MPVATGSQSIVASMPTYMSVFGEEHRASNGHIISKPPNAVNTTLYTPRIPHQSCSSTSLQPAARYRRGSGAASRTDSSTPSPTNTVSTLNSSIADSSPSLSPDSPLSLLTSSPLRPSRMAGPLLATPESTDVDPGHQSATSSPSKPPFARVECSPVKKPRNMKNLAINTNGISATQNIDSSLARAAESDNVFLPAAGTDQVPATPSFNRPPMQPKRKPSRLGLTISTPESESKSQRTVVPDTPGFAPGLGLRFNAPSGFCQLDAVPETPTSSNPVAGFHKLRRESNDGVFSPFGGPPGGMQLPKFVAPLMRTPAYAPQGGMTLPPFDPGSSESSPYNSKIRPALSLQNKTMESTNTSPIVQQTVEHFSTIPAHDLPLSREVKSPSYPNGPVCIYPPNVFLYHQPTCEEAERFDVVINVAREVLNPFESTSEPSVALSKAAKSPRSVYRDVGVQVELLLDTSCTNAEPELSPDSTSSEVSFGSALQKMTIEEGPETPKALKKAPEYIHLPWEHNSKVYEDLLDICELIDDRVSRGQRVLVHCQLGVSRSASLIVAYGIYKNPNLTPDEAREMAKKQSRWIDLNMHFMYELGDFRKLLAKKFPNVYSIRRPQVPRLQRMNTDSSLESNRWSFALSPTSPIVDDENTTPFQFGREAESAKFSSLASVAPAESEDLLVSAPPSFQPGTGASPSKPLVELERDEPTHRSKPSVPSSARALPVSTEPSVSSTYGSKPPHDFTVSLQMPRHTETIDVLPPPNLSVPSLQPARGLRNMPSLPGGFSGSIFRSSNLSFRRTLRNAPSLPALSTELPPAQIESGEISALLSPRVQELTAAPFRRTPGGGLVGSSVFESGLLSPGSQERDPRSPPTRGEMPITRSIDSLL